MSDPATAAQRQQGRQQGWIRSLISLPFRLFGMLCGSLLLAILMEWVGLLFFWPDEGWHHSERMLDHELNQLSSDFRRSIVMQAPAQTAGRLIEWTHEHVVLRSGLRDWRESSRKPVDERRLGLKRLLNLAYSNLDPCILAAGYTTLTFLVRLVVLCLALPLFLIAVFVGLIDGLVRRDLRRFGAGRESGFLYHRARTLVLPLAVLPWLVYLAVPLAIHPLWILLPAAILLCIAVNVTVGSFKKYL